jgi:2-dehydropantoate 2-reductase
MTQPSPSVLIVGAGAIGAFYGAVLARSGARVSVVSRSDHDVVRDAGFRIRSPTLGDWQFMPATCYRDVSDCRESFDYVVLAVKVLPDVDRIALLRPAVGPDSRIVLIQNGVDIEPEIATAFPSNELISTLAFVALSREGPGVIHHQSLGRLTVGTYPSGASEHAHELVRLVKAANVDARISTDIVSARWEKAVWNAVFNPFSILGGVLTTADMLNTSAGEHFVHRCMTEICATAAAVGKPQAPDLIDKQIAGTKKMPPYKTSMALDYEQGRPLELEAILGSVICAARGANLAVPTLESLYALSKVVVNARDNSAKANHKEHIEHKAKS